MLKKIRTLWKDDRLREIFLYCVVGGLTTLVNYVVYFLFTRLVGGVPAENPGLSGLLLNGSVKNVGTVLSGVLVAWVCAVAFAFYPNKRLVFRSKKGNLKRELESFFGARVLSLLIELGMMALFLIVLHMNDLIAKLIVQFVVIAANYFASKFWIFKKP